MDRELNIQIPQWQQRPLPAAGMGQVCALTRRDDLGRVSCQRLRVLAVQSQEEAVRVCQGLDMVSLLYGCANILAHIDHWACRQADSWAVCVQEPDLPDLHAYCASRSSGQEELIVLSSDPQKAAQELKEYREKRRLPDEMIIQLGADICAALEQCRAKGIGQCAVTEQTVYVSPGGDFLLGGVGIDAGEQPAGTAGLAQLLCRLLGGQNGVPAYGDERLQALVRKACAEEMDVMELWQALDRLAAGEPEPEPEKKVDTLISVLEGIRVQKETVQAEEEQEEPEQPEYIAPVAAPGWAQAGDLDQRFFEVETDYSRIIRQKASLSAVLSAGNEHTVCLLNDGSAVAVGRNGNQQCQVNYWRGLQAVAAGDGHSVGLRTDGTVVAVGSNGYGQCSVDAWKNIVQISVGSLHTVGLKADGTVVAVGKKIDGCCSVELWKDVAAITAGADHTVGLRSNGTVVAVGNNKYGQCNVGHWRDIVAVSAGAGHTVGLKADGTVVAVGWNSSGKCQVSDWTDIAAIAAGALHTVGVKKDGTVVSVGNNGAGRCDVSGWKDVVAITAGSDHTVGLCLDGTLLATGLNSFGQCQLGSVKKACVPGVENKPAKDLPDSKEQLERDLTAKIREKANMTATLSAGHTHSACVMDNGTVICTGNQHNTRAWRMMKAVAVGFGHTVGLRVNGRLLAEGSNNYGQCNVGGWEDIIQVVVGDHHTVGLRSDGTVVAVGNNNKGQCDVGGWKNIAAISAGAEHTVGLRSDGTVVAVGNNTYGQLLVSDWKNIVAISAGCDHTVGLRENGRVVAVGNNQDAQCAVASWTHIQGIAAGMNHTVGVMANGAVIAIGRDAFGQCNVAKWKGVLAVSAGRQYTLGLRVDGSVVATGLNSHGQCRVLTWRRVSIPKAL